MPSWLITASPAWLVSNPLDGTDPSSQYAIALGCAKLRTKNLPGLLLARALPLSSDQGPNLNRLEDAPVRPSFTRSATASRSCCPCSRVGADISRLVLCQTVLLQLPPRNILIIGDSRIQAHHSFGFFVLHHLPSVISHLTNPRSNTKLLRLLPLSLHHEIKIVSQNRLSLSPYPIWHPPMDSSQALLPHPSLYNPPRPVKRMMESVVLTIVFCPI